MSFIGLHIENGGAKMPTEYTHALLKGEQTVEEFALGCARAFGAYVEMKDEPLSVGAPEKLEDKETELYLKNIADLQRQIRNVKKMSYARAAKYAENDYNSSRLYHTNALIELAEGSFRLSKAMAQVASYTPPTKDHEEYKSFMVRQLSETMDWSCDPSYHKEALKNLKLQTPQEWKADKLEYLSERIEFKTKSLEKYTVRHTTCNDWIKQLHSSVKGHFSNK